MFDLKISLANAVGIALTLAGGGWYTTVELREKRRARFTRESLSSNIYPISVEMGRGFNGVLA